LSLVVLTVIEGCNQMVPVLKSFLVSRLKRKLGVGLVGMKWWKNEEERMKLKENK